MEITAFTPDDTEALAAFVALEAAVHAADSPWVPDQSVRAAAARFRHGWDGEPTRPHLARVDGEVVGWGGVSTSDYDNLDLAWISVQVHPDHRGRGRGSAILAAMEDRCARAGRSVLGIDGWESDATSGFAKRHGYERRLSSINRRQYLADIDWPELDRRYDAALPHAADYALERWPVPTAADRLEELAVMASAINDAPTDDLDYEDEVFSGDRMRAYEDATLGRGQRMYRLVARHRLSGELAGQTVIAVDLEHPEYGEQHDTTVTRPHRGHRLGLLLKTEMLRWLAQAEPQLAEIDTWNAESNDHMIGVNQILGYRVMGRELAYQRPRR